MLGTINDQFRQQLLLQFINGEELDNVFLVFSHDTTRTEADPSDLILAPVTSVHDGTDTIAKYAVRLDRDNILKYAKLEDLTADGSSIIIDGVVYTVTDDIDEQLDKIWTSAYFSVPIEAGAMAAGLQTDGVYNVVSVVFNMTVGPSENKLFSFNSNTLENAGIILQTRPANKDLLEMPEEQFTGLIRF